MGGSHQNAECCLSPSDLATVSVSRCGDCAPPSAFLCGKEIFFTRSKFIEGWPGSLPFCFAPRSRKAWFAHCLPRQHGKLGMCLVRRKLAPMLASFQFWVPAVLS